MRTRYSEEPIPLYLPLELPRRPEPPPELEEQAPDSEEGDGADDEEGGEGTVVLDLC